MQRVPELPHGITEQSPLWEEMTVGQIRRGRPAFTTQTALAKRIADLGLKTPDSAAISLILRGKSPGNQKTCENICAALGIDEWWELQRRQEQWRAKWQKEIRAKFRDASPFIGERATAQPVQAESALPPEQEALTRMNLSSLPEELQARIKAMALNLYTAQTRLLSNRISPEALTEPFDPWYTHVLEVGERVRFDPIGKGLVEEVLRDYEDIKAKLRQLEQNPSPDGQPPSPEGGGQPE